MNDRPAWLAKRASEATRRPTVTTTANPKNHNKWHNQPLSLSFSHSSVSLSLFLSVAPRLMYKTLRALISYYSLFLYAIRTSISVFVVVHKKHISATTTTLREPGLDSGRTDGQWDRGQGTGGLTLNVVRQSQQQAASQRPARCLLSARKSVYF